MGPFWPKPGQSDPRFGFLVSFGSLLHQYQPKAMEFDPFPGLFGVICSPATCVWRSPMCVLIDVASLRNRSIMRIISNNRRTRSRRSAIRDTDNNAAAAMGKPTAMPAPKRQKHCAANSPRQIFASTAFRPQLSRHVAHNNIFTSTYFHSTFY